MPRPRLRRRWRLRVGISALSLALLGGGAFLYQRYVRLNFATVVEGQAYRSAQPTPDALRKWHDEFGLRTVVNLRGRYNDEEYKRETETARQLGMEMISIRMSAESHPSAVDLRTLVRALEEAPRPILLHCKAGADRTGFASVLAAMALGGEDFESARRHLTWRHLHIVNTESRITGLLDQYEAWCREQGLGTDGWGQFRTWATQVYHPYYYKLEVACPATLRARPGEKVNVDVTYTNRAKMAIPAGDPKREFNATASLGESTFEDPTFTHLCRGTPLPKRDLAPGESATVTVPLNIPKEPGVYDVRFDVVEENVAWFCWEGSPVGHCELTVEAPTTAPADAAQP